MSCAVLPAVILNTIFELLVAATVATLINCNDEPVKLRRSFSESFAVFRTADEATFKFPFKLIVESALTALVEFISRTAVPDKFKSPLIKNVEKPFVPV